MVELKAAAAGKTPEGVAVCRCWFCGHRGGAESMNRFGVGGGEKVESPMLKGDGCAVAGSEKSWRQVAAKREQGAHFTSFNMLDWKMMMTPSGEEQKLFGPPAEGRPPKGYVDNGRSLSSVGKNVCFMYIYFLFWVKWVLWLYGLGLWPSWRMHLGFIIVRGMCINLRYYTVELVCRFNVCTVNELLHLQAPAELISWRESEFLGERDVFQSRH
ncbi:hypothetical protein MLD38_036997 [Melastoma candidum]|uniref:Uncharacterized protein n=1 Tax=Melastoma candidum TaxID=119954 RepID=A0ACB9LNA6_9MYRT|nr:hypothetical protein MLD38_036997 [Melastoma candidum]